MRHSAGTKAFQIILPLSFALIVLVECRSDEDTVTMALTGHAPSYSTAPRGVGACLDLIVLVVPALVSAGIGAALGRHLWRGR
ncbi:MAG TPA: hypothetical protein VII73_12070 [Caulobacteraceae bacterium]